jgi:hypothetical protein
MQQLDSRIYRELKRIGKTRGVNVTTLIRAVVIPEWRAVQEAEALGPSLSDLAFQKRKRRSRIPC